MDTNEVLISILEMLRQQAIYLHRQHGWVIAVAETLRQNPEMAKSLEQHPFYDQGPRQDIQTTDATIRNIDALIQQLKG
jgi:hypothetical protein